MDQNESEEPHEDFVVEITNLHQDDEEGSSNTPRFFMEIWLLSHRYRKQKTMAATICMGLALLIVLFALTPVSRLFLRGSPPTVEPSTYYFGLDANPPWGLLSVDGKRVALFSRGAYTLFSLPPGQHTLKSCTSFSMTFIIVRLGPAATGLVIDEPSQYFNNCAVKVYPV